MKRRLGTLLLLLTILLVAGGLGYLGYTAYDTKKQLDASAKTLEREQTALEASKASENKVDVAESSFLQKKVPVIPAIDDIVDSIDAASQIAGVTLKGVNFTGSAAQTPVTPVAPVEPASDVTTTPAIDAVQTEGAPPATPNMPIADATPLPASLQVEAPSYAELLAFLKQLERTDRISVLRQIQLTGPEEPGPNEALVTLDEPLAFTVEIESYYRPDLAQLQEEKKTPVKETTPKSDPFVDAATN
ncbi:hypothetical protein [Exiguobacterium flavidum]|uniref:hypothetical protein n=1 Tax=Exiguobacterium flavidum TaxID=2184695 RepID=UPI000DF7EA99|nr:hypothetical protein [Exiguobacterium flavidum]